MRISLHVCTCLLLINEFTFIFCVLSKWNKAIFPKLHILSNFNLLIANQIIIGVTLDKQQNNSMFCMMYLGLGWATFFWARLGMGWHFLVRVELELAFFDLGHFGLLILAYFGTFLTNLSAKGEIFQFGLSGATQISVWAR